MIRIIYKAAYTLGFLLTWPYWILRDVLHHKPYSFKARFLGPGRMLPKQKGRPRVWVWALSLGEVLAAKELVPLLEEAGAEVIITSTTAIGRDAAAKTFPGRLVLASPLDFGLSTRRFLDFVTPDLLVLIETDIWPGILFNMQLRGLPKALISSRISPRSYRGYSYIKAFWGQVLQLFDLITTQNEDDRARLVALGATPQTTMVIGDLKFDRQVKVATAEAKNSLLAETGWPDGRWIVAGSTHAGEEAIIVDVFTKLKTGHAGRFDDLKLLIAPRNKSDFEAVRNLIRERGLDAGYRGSPDEADKNRDIFLLDTLGELERFYDLAEVALVGKSWAGQHKGGGHNPLEPAAKGKPVLFGPMTHNYRWMTRALEGAGGGRMVPDKETLLTALEELLNDPDKIAEMGRKAAEFVSQHQGGTKRTLDLLLPLFEKDRAGQQRS